MKKEYSVVYLLIGILAVVFVLTRMFPHARLADLVGSATSVSSVVSQKKATTTLTIDFGDTKKTYTDIVSTTVFDALKEATGRDSIAISGKQYEFGFLVEAIGTTANTKEKSWIYYVNGVSGDVASDKKSIVAGDQIEWKYVTPN